MKKLFLLLCGIGLVACSGPSEDLQSWMQDATKQAKMHKNKETQTDLIIEASYTPPTSPALNAFDPARLRMGVKGVNAPNLNRPKQTLENFNLEDLHYVGQITSKNKSPAAFIEASGHVYTVGIGNYIGQDYGRITAITPNEIRFTEQVEDSNGSWTNRANTLSLQENDSNNSAK